MESFTFNAEDIFKEIDGDSDNILMNIPQEILDLTGWKDGDILDISIEDEAIVVKKHG